MIYDKIVLLGTGKLFLNCLSYVDGLHVPYEGYEMSTPPSKITLAQAKNKGLCCCSMSKALLFQKLSQERSRILLLSVINPAILPEWMMKMENIVAINCHQALLPKYKGRNAECWAIYEGEEKSGITWHRMDAGVDTGEILIQKEVPITETTTAYSLFRQQLGAAYEAFLEFMPKVLAGEETYHPQPKLEEESFHYSWEAPEAGRMDPRWSQERISRLLRATDYGILKVMKRPVLVMEGQEYGFQSYKILRREEAGEDLCRFDGNRIVIEKKEYQFILEKWEALNKNER
ncbi:MAG: formyltransferase family protein [Eubacteriales bacterium]|nr:formyltransferase family protein [Eubacteriales bacterium]